MLQLQWPGQGRAGHLNRTDLNTVLPEFYNNVDIKTGKCRILDQVYTDVPGACKTRPSPHLGHSDRLSVFLTRAYETTQGRAGLRRQRYPCRTVLKTFPNRGPWFDARITTFFQRSVDGRRRRPPTVETLRIYPYPRNLSAIFALRPPPALHPLQR